ncbi:MAG: DUF4127 family protein [Blautia sp.]
MGKIIFLPLDERPCNYVYPMYIGKISGMDVEMVPKSLMGNFKKAADVNAIWEWTREKAENGDILIVSMDLFLYGGIVPSRLHQLSSQVCCQRLERLRSLKREKTDLTIYAFQLITRAPARDGSGEEPDYYEDYGYRIYRYGVLLDKERLNMITEEEAGEKEQIEEEVPLEVREDFLRRRAINYENNKRTIDLAAEGIIDFLIIPQDDCRAYGYAPSERRGLAAYAAEKSMFSRIYFYPGADEVGCTLLARAINQTAGKAPLIYPDYSSLRGKYQIPSYEDRSIGETVQYQLLAAGCRIAETSREADGILLVHPPTEFSLRLEKELISDEIYMESERNLQAFTERIKEYLERGQLCGVADCAIPNTADRALMQFLYEQGLLERIGAYGGWNTSSNTLGTVIAHLTALFHTDKDQGKTCAEEFRFFRYLEDWGYMAEVRRKVSDMLPELGEGVHVLNLGDKTEKVRELIDERLKSFQETYFKTAPWDFEIGIPWNRMFEIEIKLKTKKNS